MPYVMIGHLAMCHYWISWFNLINPMIWFDLISLITLLDLINLTQVFFPSPPCGRLQKRSPITFRRILFVRLIPHKKYTGTVHPYIPSSVSHVKPSWEKPLYSYLLMATLFTDTIIICICSVVQRETGTTNFCCAIWRLLKNKKVLRAVTFCF